MPYKVEQAKIEEKDLISELIRSSVWGLSKNDYTAEQIEAALKSAWGVDTQLIQDGTYFVVRFGSDLAGCGGWSFRKTLFGGDHREDRDTSCLDPRSDAAKIRAFFIHPAHSRKGLGSMLLTHCEQAAWDAGFRRMELGATAPGRRLYQQHSYKEGDPYEFSTSANTSLTIIPMYKSLDTRPA